MLIKKLPEKHWIFGQNQNRWEDNMQIIMIGAGNIGLLFGLSLIQNKHNVIFYEEESIFQQLNKKSISLITLQKEIIEFPPLQIRTISRNPINSSSSPNTSSPLCIIATKAYSLSRICRDYSSLLSQISILILIQNGLGNEEIIYQNYPHLSIFRIITSNGAQKSNITQLIHTGCGDTNICPVPNPYQNNSSLQIDSTILQTFISALRLAGFNPQISSCSEETIWQKAIINIGINAVGAITRLNNGEIYSSHELKQIIEEIVKETLKIINKLHIPINPKKDYIHEIYLVLQSTAHNKNSMLQDVLSHSPTEIDFLNGKIVEYGKKLGISTPYNQAVFNFIKAIEITYIHERSFSNTTEHDR